MALPFMPNLPGNSSCIGKQEQALAQWRIRRDAGEETDSDSETGHGHSLTGLKLALKDQKVWLFTAIAFCFTSFGSVALVLPSIIEGLGFSKVKTEFMTAPPYVSSRTPDDLPSSD